MTSYISVFLPACANDQPPECPFPPYRISADPGLPQNPFPFPSAEPPQDGQRGIILHQPGGGERCREQADRMIRDRMPLQIVDEPACGRMLLHPPKLADQLFIREVMTEQR